MRSTQKVEMLMENFEDVSEEDLNEHEWGRTSMAIAQEIRLWSEKVLEVSSPLFGGMPPCPYAKQAWLRETVMIHVIPDLDSVTEVKAYHPPTDDLIHVMALPDYESIPPDVFDAWIEKQNKNHFGTWVMGFHPNSPENPLTEPFEGTIEDDYAIIVVQSYKQLVEASDTLDGTEYYSRFPQSDLDYVAKRKETYDAWNEKVDAEIQTHFEETALQSRIEGTEVEH